jgi:hypothetical protein
MEGSFDCVATCFFIDTAHNVIDYLEARGAGAWVFRLGLH